MTSHGGEGPGIGGDGWTGMHAGMYGIVPIFRLCFCDRSDELSLNTSGCVIFPSPAANHNCMHIDQFNSLLQRHAGLIYKVAFTYCRNPTNREDVIQEIAMQLWRSRGRYDDRYKETTWIYRIAINVAVSFHRRERRHIQQRASLDRSAFTIAAPTTEPNQHLELLMRCIDELGDLEKALVLLYLDGTDHASIAGVLGISVSNVGTKLQRIKTKLGVAFQRHLQATHAEKSYGTR